MLIKECLGNVQQFAFSPVRVRNESVLEPTGTSRNTGYRGCQFTAGARLRRCDHLRLRQQEFSERPCGMLNILLDNPHDDFWRLRPVN